MLLKSRWRQRQPYTSLTFMERLFPRLASASQIQTLHLCTCLCRYCCPSKRSQTYLLRFYWNQAVRWEWCDHVHQQHWELSGVSTGLSALAWTKWRSEVSPLLPVDFGYSFCLFNLSNYSHCWEQIKKVQENFSLFCFAWTAMRLHGSDFWCLMSSMMLNVGCSRRSFLSLDSTGVTPRLLTHSGDNLHQICSHVM